MAEHHGSTSIPQDPGVLAKPTNSSRRTAPSGAVCKMTAKPQAPSPSPAKFSPGIPVALGDVDRQLGLLWEHSDAGKVRASLVNLVIYSESPDAIAENTPLLSQIASDHAFRALLVQADPQAKTSGVNAWITAHCHTRAAGQKEICSEQVTFTLDGSAAAHLPNIVFSHLDSDLPLYLWWQGELPHDPDPQFWRWADRLIVDSSSWKQPAAQFPVLHKIEGLGRGRCAIADLSWTRLFHLLYAVAQVFDIPAARSRIGQLQEVSITHAPAQRVTALELLGWIASRLDWRLDKNRTMFLRPDGGTCAFALRESPGATASITRVGFGFGDGEATIRRESGADFYLLDFAAKDTAPCSQMMPAGREKTADILLSELSRATRHPLFWPAVRVIEPLL